MMPWWIVIVCSQEREREKHKNHHSAPVGIIKCEQLRYSAEWGEKNGFIKVFTNELIIAIKNV